MPLYRCSKKINSEDRITTEEELLKVFRGYVDSDKGADDPLRFEFNKRYYVEVAHASGKGFYVYCRHEQHSFETLVPYDGVQTGFTIEEFLTDFWDHRVRQKYNFDEEPEMRNADFTATASLPLRVFFPLVFFVMPLLFLAIDGKGFAGNTGPLLKTELWVLIALAPYWILFVQYYAYTRNRTLRISQKEKLITMEQNGETIAIRFPEITRARIISNEGGHRRPLYGTWAYLRIEAGPQKRIIVTDLLVEELNRISEMLPGEVKREPSLYPLIRQQKKSDKEVAEEKASLIEKSAEFEERWKNKSSKELEEVIKNADQYADFAVDAARRMLKRK
jgi:hypothetical protein